MVEELTAENFDEKIKEGKVIVDCWAPWCGPCRMFGPEFEAASKESDAKFFKVNVDEQQAIAQKLGVRGIPAIFFFKDGELVSQKAGARQKAQLLTEIQEIFG